MKANDIIAGLIKAKCELESDDVEVTIRCNESDYEDFEIEALPLLNHIIIDLH